MCGYLCRVDHVDGMDYTTLVIDNDPCEEKAVIELTQTITGMPCVDRRMQNRTGLTTPVCWQS